MKAIEIPFGAKDSELKGWEYTIPEGMEAEIKDGKIVVREKESEDERIRKGLVKLLTRASGAYLVESTGIKKDSYLAYLEKQKEYVSDNFDDVWTTEDCAEIIEVGEKLSPRFKELLKEVCHAWYDKGIELGKQKEQKPNIEICPHSIKSKSYKENGYPIVQKPAEWSEEDEKIVNNIVYVLGQYIDYKAVSGTGSGYATPRYSKEIDWLKSLRPVSKESLQSHWKPSEEQMEALEYVIRDYREDSCNATANYLQEILDHLKNM